MQKTSLGYKLGLAALLTLAFYSCKKSNGINNNSVVETPYGLYFADSSGALINTNDGVTFNPVVFPPDGFPSRALCISGDNLLWVKKNLYFAVNGSMFNHSYDSVQRAPELSHADSLAINGLPIRLNQSIILRSNDESRVYIASMAPNALSRMGIAYSEQDGALGSWLTDTLTDTFRATVTSFTELKNNTVVAYDAVHNRVFTRSGATAVWTEQNPVVPPTAPTGKLPYNGFFSLGHYNNTVIAIDNSGRNGAWRSEDNGATWFKYAGLPANIPLLSVASPFDQTLLVGTDSAGLYRLNVNTGMFEPNLNGLGNYVVVWGIAAKQNIYKNSSIQQYIYLATNKGIYQSSDAGQNWILTKPGNYVSIY